MPQPLREGCPGKAKRAEGFKSKTQSRHEGDSWDGSGSNSASDGVRPPYHDNSVFKFGSNKVPDGIQSPYEDDSEFEFGPECALERDTSSGSSAETPESPNREIRSGAPSPSPDAPSFDYWKRGWKMARRKLRRSDTARLALIAHSPRSRYRIDDQQQPKLVKYGEHLQVIKRTKPVIIPRAMKFKKRN